MATRDVLFIQGAGPDVHEGWDRRLVESLRRELGDACDVRYPPMPNEAEPTFAAWRPVIERELAALRPGGIVVGHSVGGTTTIHTLADSPLTAVLHAIVLIAAPYIGDGGWASDEYPPGRILGERLPASVPVLLYHGEADNEVPVSHVERYAAELPRAHVRRLAGRDHQLNDDLSDVARDILALDSR